MTRNADDSGSPVREFRVLALNVWHSGSKVSHGTELIADLIVETRASIVLLSEATEATTAVAAELARRGHEFNAVSSHDTGILTVFPVEDSADLRWMVKARLDIGGRRLTVYSAHLEFRWYACNLPRGYGPGVPQPDEFAEYNFEKLPGGPVTDSAVIQRVNAASGRPDVIGGFLADAKTEAAQGASVIMAGDLNEPSELDWTPATANMFDHNGVVVAWESTRLLHEAGFIDAYRSTYPDPVTHPGLTWPSDNVEVDVSELAWAPEADERDRVDFVFARGTALTLSTVGIVGPRGTIVRGTRHEEPTEDNFAASPARWCSDHKGILATYELAD
ncbi:endonuclease/exonuclease/phosphatase family protein [Nocardia colli]|uniref:Endonuclease/exonuclease/phosphatase family protein n=1 Tax=Nocardia colli TaxID=2545717 RepID=A0A5N0E4G9_9NOCA|nr:endonuclease/exonuclease/phosphatase family protein [Nocardia colli]KAA8883883.1 endonuclease/exonuclease/phosphatase family protein [Nocardia colli]